MEGDTRLLSTRTREEPSSSSLDGLLRRIEGRRTTATAALSAAAPVQQQAGVMEGTSSASPLPPPPAPTTPPPPLVFADMVTYEGPADGARGDAGLRASVLMQFDEDGFNRARPSAARAAADAARRVPEEALGLHVAPHPRINDASLYKLEQRLARAVTLDAAAVSRRAAEGPGAPLPASAPAASAARWFGPSGLMLYEPSPLNPHAERPPRRRDQDAAATATAYAPAAVSAGNDADEGRSYRLDVAVGAIEFAVHPLMAREHQLAAQLLALFRDFKRRQSRGLVGAHARRLAALEVALLRAREALFAAADAQQQAAEATVAGATSGGGGRRDGSVSPSSVWRGDDAADSAAARLGECAELERAVADARRARDREAALLAGAVDAMARVWARLQRVRAEQGAALTRLQVRLVPRGAAAIDGDVDAVSLQHGGGGGGDTMTRRELDAALAAAEQEQIHGFEGGAWAAACAGGSGSGGSSGVPATRRVETMCAAHAAAVAEARERLEFITARASADPADPEAVALRARLAQLGRVPRRVMRAQLLQPPQQQQQHSSSSAPLEPVLVAGPSTATNAARVEGPRFKGHCRYWARLVINGRPVGATRVVDMRPDFSVPFQDVFSVRLLRWPEALELEIYESALLCDRLVAALRLPVPGAAAGAPHIDPAPRPCRWVGVDPVPAGELARAAALLYGGAAPLAAPPLESGCCSSGGADGSSSPMTGGLTRIGGQQQQQRPRVSGNPAGSPVAAPAPAVATTTTTTSSGGAGSSEPAADYGTEPLYPRGVVYVRSGWVPEGGFDAVPGASSGMFGGAAAAATMGKAAATYDGGSMADQKRVASTGGLLMAATDKGSSGGGDATATLTLVRPFAGSPSPPPLLQTADKGNKHTAPWVTYDNPLSSDGVSGGGAGGLSSTAGFKAATAVHTNPLAAHAPALPFDIETGAALTPPRPHVSALWATAGGRRTAGAAAAASAAACDDLDPYGDNAPDAHHLAPRSPAFRVPGAHLRPGAPAGLEVAAERAAGARAAFLRRRWAAGGVSKAGSAGGASGTRSTGDGDAALPLGSLVAALSARDTLSTQDAHDQALAKLEAAALGIPPAVLPAAASTFAGDADGGGGGALIGGMIVSTNRHERAARWAQGALARALEDRQQRFRDFALKLRAAGSGARGPRGGGGGNARIATGDVVRDAPAPTLRFDAAALAALMQPSRPLRPRRRDAPRATAAVPRETTLVVTVQRAANLPARLTPPQGALLHATRSDRWGTINGGAEDDLGSGQQQQLSVFVEAAFRGAAGRTAAVDGPAPIWNEHFGFPVFDLHSDASPLALRESDGVLTLAVFDEVPARGDRGRQAPYYGGGSAGNEDAEGAAAGGLAAAWDRLAEGGRPRARERRYLGSLSLGLAAVYQAECIEGTFRLDVPPVLLGYQTADSRPATLSVVVALRPRLAAPAPPDKQLRSGEQADVARRAARWVPALRALPQARKRHVRALAVDAAGLGTALPRFVARTPLPPALQDLAAALPGAASTATGPAWDRFAAAAARWAAALPFVDDAAHRRARADVWTSSADAIALGGGDHEEHAHLLAGLLLEAGAEALVVLGTSLRGAAAAFVLTTGRRAGGGNAPVSVQQQQPPQQQQQASEQASREDAQQQPQQQQPTSSAQPGAWDAAALRLWDPLTARCTPVTDPACELWEVGTLYDGTNIWVNIQAAGRPCALSWDLSVAADWRPFFGGALPPRALAPVQSAAAPPDYADLDARAYEELEARAEEAVRDALYDARSVVVTQPSNKLSRVLKALLRELPRQLADVDAAGLAAADAAARAGLYGGGIGSCASGGGVSGGEGGAAAAAGDLAEVAEERLRARQRLLRSLQAAHNDRVAREMRGCSVSGAVLALPFSDAWARAAAAAVLGTGLHRTVDARVRFAMATHVERLGGPWVCRIWIYVAAVRDAAV